VILAGASASSELGSRKGETARIIPVFARRFVLSPRAGPIQPILPRTLRRKMEWGRRPRGFRRDKTRDDVVETHGCGNCK
jgi:hypothetical protein